jgi:hypothetical protein
MYVTGGLYLQFTFLTCCAIWEALNVELCQYPFLAGLYYFLFKTSRVPYSGSGLQTKAMLTAIAWENSNLFAT